MANRANINGVTTEQSSTLSFDITLAPGMFREQRKRTNEAACGEILQTMLRSNGAGDDDRQVR
jgi:hypothetical protein